MMEFYYAAAVLTALISSIVYLAQSKESDIYSPFSICPSCGARMIKLAGKNNPIEQACPSCACHSDEFGNHL